MVSPRKSRRKSACFLQHDHIDAGACQEVPQHHAARPAADDATLRGECVYAHETPQGGRSLEVPPRQIGEAPPQSALFNALFNPWRCGLSLSLARGHPRARQPCILMRELNHALREVIMDAA